MPDLSPPLSNLAHHTPLTLRVLPLTPYQQVWDLQKTLQRALLDGLGEDTLIICEHPATVTLGKGAKRENLLVSGEEFASRDVPVFEVERGGDVTYHGPGQIVAYPIIDLSKKKCDVGWYMRGLEEVVLRTLARFEIKGIRVAGKTGVWIDERRSEFSTCEIPNKKIASLGVRISRWKTLHGLAINVLNSKEGFSLINPCGFTDIEVTSIEEEWKNSAPTPSMELVQKEVVRNFCEVFSYTIRSA